MRNKKYSSKWKTDPRAAYIPGVVFASFFIVLCLAVSPAWSFEYVKGPKDASALKYSSSPSMVDSCLPLLKSIHSSSPASAMERTQRSAGTAAAVGLVLGVRFALSPPENAKPQANVPRLELWEPTGSMGNDRSALSVAAYRQCQKTQALTALREFRWAR